MNILPVNQEIKQYLSENNTNKFEVRKQDNTYFKQKIRGPMIPVITHYDENNQLNFNALEHNLNYILQFFKTGYGCLLGAAAGGDFSVLNLEERKQLISNLVRINNKRCFLGVSVQGTDSRDIVALAQHAEKEGANFIQISPTYYYESSFSDFKRILDAIINNTQQIAIMLYNTPWEGFDLSLDQLVELANNYPRIVALKWSTEDNSKYMKAIHVLKDRFAVIDNHGLHTISYMLGATGFISHYSTINPIWDLNTHTLLEKGDYQKAMERLVSVNFPWRDFRIKIWNRSALESPVVKKALELVNRPGGPVRLPSRQLTDEETKELRDLLFSFNNFFKIENGNIVMRKNK